MRVTLSDAKNFGISEAIGIASCDAKFLKVLNEAQQRLVMGPQKWWGLLYKYRVSVTDGLITWPREIASIENIMKCGRGISIRDQWFEFIESGYGARDADAYCGDTDLSNYKWDNQMFDRGMFPCFREIDTDGDEMLLKLYSTLDEDASQYIVVFGYDWDGNWLRTEVTAGNFEDGLRINVPVTAGGSTLTSVYVRQIVDVVKPATNGILTLKQKLSVAPSTETTLATWQPEETRPSYRRSFVGDICSTDDTVITVLAKREFFPARYDNDFLMLGSLPAIKEMMQAVIMYEQDRIQEAAMHEMKAYEILDREAQHYIGSGTLSPVRIINQGWGAGQVPNLY